MKLLLEWVSTKSNDDCAGQVKRTRSTLEVSCMLKEICFLLIGVAPVAAPILNFAGSRHLRFKTPN